MSVEAFGLQRNRSVRLCGFSGLGLKTAEEQEEEDQRDDGDHLRPEDHGLVDFDLVGKNPTPELRSPKGKDLGCRV